MVVKKEIKRQIFMEILALIFIILVIIYAIFAINVSGKNKVTSHDGMVLALDDSKFSGLQALSDGEGLNTEGVTYTITNNNKEKVSYKILLSVNTALEDVINNIRISEEDIFIDDLSKLERYNGEYVIGKFSLDPGYTKVHVFKTWYKLGTKKDVLDKKVKFTYEVVKE